ncbi:MAG: hypothetical protein LBN06_00500 [Prevotellaceae bacterium]|jgi:hypothetical protein|nr:hypothetical protein [Prevotellaceae bacterium]
MDGIIEFLILVGILAFGAIREYKKEARKNAGAKPVTPEKEPEQEVFVPRPFNPFEREVSLPKKTPQPKKKKQAPRPFLSQQEAVTAIEAAEPPVVEVEETATESEYTIHSAEEARKAIVWGEILQRKY